MSAVFICGSGLSLGEYEESNGEVAQRLNISEEDILSKSGIKKRFIAKNTSNLKLGCDAFRNAIENYDINLKTVDGVIVCSFTNDYVFPNIASAVSKEFDLSSVFAFDVQANCAGLQVGLNIARDKLLANKDMKKIAVIAIAKQSPFLNPVDINTAYFFSDAASCLILEAKDSSHAGLMNPVSKVVTSNYEAVRLRAGGAEYRNFSALEDKTKFYEHAGMAVWKETIVQIPKIIRETLIKYNWNLEEVDYILMHQANLRLMEFIFARLSVPLDKTILTIEDMGNTADASLGTVIHKALDNDFFKPGMKILLLSVGSGFIYECGGYIPGEKV